MVVRHQYERVSTKRRMSHADAPACDLCHAAKQKCSGDRPSCTRCAQGGWQCVYAPRQRRRTVPKDQKMVSTLDARHAMSLSGLVGKKRKLQRDGMSLAGDSMDMRMAMGMAMDLGLGEEEEDEHLLTMSDEQMVCLSS